MKRYVWTSLPLAGGLVAAIGLAWWAYPPRAEAHCQVPCGIYDDAARIARMREDSTTIAKAITNINELAGQHHSGQVINQAVRWVDTKESHASHIITVVSEYFLAQKVKPVTEGQEGFDAYLRSLADHHAVIVAAMKTKQDADPATVEALNKAIDALAKHY